MRAGRLLTAAPRSVGILVPISVPMACPKHQNRAGPGSWFPMSEMALPVLLLLAHCYVPDFLPGLPEEEGERGELVKQTRAASSNPCLPNPSPRVWTPLLCYLPMCFEGLSVIRL